MPMSTSQPRPTFTPRSSTFPQKIAIEEAVATSVFTATTTNPPQTGTGELPYDRPEYVSDIEKRLVDVDLRVQSMDAGGVTLGVVSLTMPGIEGIFDAKEAVDAAAKVNDEIRTLYTSGAHADRFQALGCVPMQDPGAAAREAERCVKELGFLGILVNGYSNLGDANTIQYLDEPQCEPFWAKLEQLDVPLYLHPRIPAPGQMRIYEGYEFLGGSPWGFSTETATHALRLMLSGLFDRHPLLKIILGHCGEGLPFAISRADHRMRHFKKDGFPCERSLQSYFEANFWVTTAGIMDTGTLEDTVKICGEDKVLWSVDYPYESYEEMAGWFDHLEMNRRTRAKIGWENARRLLKLGD